MATVERGKFTPRPRNDPSYYGGKFPFIQTGDISDSGGRLHTWTQTLNEKGTRVSRSFSPGTIVIAIVGATIGKTAILEVEVFCPDSVVGIQVDQKQATKEYIEFLLRFWRPTFLAQAPETARANINLDTLRPLRVPVPPLSLQKKFSDLVDRLEQLRSAQRESLRQASEELSKVRTKIQTLEREQQTLEFEIADSELFLKHLDKMLHELDGATATYEGLGGLRFEYCPSCFTAIEVLPDNVSDHCLCVNHCSAIQIAAHADCP